MILQRFKRLGFAQRFQILFFAIFAYPVGGWCLWEFVHATHDLTKPVVSGRVVSRKEIQRLGGIPGARLDIVLVESNEKVYSILPRSELLTFPDNLSVHYSGIPDSEVRIQGEESPYFALFGCAMLWLIPIPLVNLYSCWNTSIEKEMKRRANVDIAECIR